MNPTELLMRRRNVKAFIDADPISLELTRLPERTKSPAGGYTLSAPAAIIPPQVARIVLNKRRYNNGIVNAEAGEIPHTDYLLIGMHTLNVEVDDTFTWLGENYTITGKYKARQESTLCSIDLLGPDNRAG
jgi:hypothetical protein